jgi:pilus assembly protein FimV
MPEVKQEQESEPEPEPEVNQEQESEPEPEPEVNQEQESEPVPEPEVNQEQESEPVPEVNQEKESEPEVEVKQDQEQESVPIPEVDVNQEPEPMPDVKQSNMKIESINAYINEEELLNSNVTTEPETRNINNVQPSVMPVPIIPESNNNKAIDLNSIVDSIVDVIAGKILEKINTSNNLDKTSAEKLNTTLTAIESRSNIQQGAGYKKTIKKKKLKYVYNPRTKTLRRKR